MRVCLSSFAVVAVALVGGCDRVSLISRTPSASGLGGAGGSGAGTVGSSTAGSGGQVGSTAVGLPCAVQTILVKYCSSCHGAPPSGGAPRSLVTYADLTRTDPSNSSMTEAQAALQRIQDKSSPMPPSGSKPTSAEIATLQSWVSNNYPTGTCGVVSNGGASGGGGSTGSDGAGGSSGHGGSGGGNGGSSQAGSEGTGGSSQPGSGGTGRGADAGIPGGTLPCDVQTLLVNRCDSCHGTTPSGGAPRSLVTYANLTSADPADTSMTEAQVALQRMRSPSSPMPPSPAAAATSAEIATLQNWINAGYPSGSCGGDAGAPPADPLNASPTCTSKVTWNRGTTGSSSMEPGQACISCHAKSGEAPTFVIAGTLYPTGHEPDNCNGVNGTTGAKVVVTGNNGTSVTLTPNSAGNFYSSTTLPPPYKAKVVSSAGVERVMSSTASTGDCNSCHTQSGANNAPGRITLP
jgi:hypothetical protein